MDPKQLHSFVNPTQLRLQTMSIFNPEGAHNWLFKYCLCIFLKLLGFDLGCYCQLRPCIKLVIVHIIILLLI